MPSGTGHFTGSSKRVEAHSKSSNLVVNLVALSRDLPVVTGFFEIIRVVKPKYSLLLFRFYKKANFNKPFLKKGSFSGFTFELSKSGGLFEWK